MKHFIVAAFSLAGAFASPTRLASRAISTELFDRLKLFAQYAAAAQCNNLNEPGKPLSCVIDGVCPLVEAANTTTIASFVAEETDTNGFIAVDHTRSLIVVSFRGTESWENVITDLHVAQVPCTLTAGCKTHEGFTEAWADVKETVFSGVATAKAAHPTYQLVVTGHSLGGAVGTLAAAHLRDAGDPADLYTYGSPRVGNLEFVRYVTEKQAGAEYRVTNWRDIVPTMPTMTGLYPYRHTSPEYWVSTKDYETQTSPETIVVCEGYGHRDCSEEGFPSQNHHLWYLGPITGCSAKNLED